MDNQQQENKAKLKKGLVHAALTAATIATFLAAKTSETSAYEGWSEYKNEQTLNLTGEIQNVNYENPHATIEVKTDDNKVWQAILAPPAECSKLGLPQGILQVGQKVELKGYLYLPTELNEMWAEKIVIDNKTIELV
ncbi:MAG: DUF6152 family protein [Scytonema sp. PMC 1069.18]|nr:DUF6152 family protein [Scytonema sp. PMC 1069.18]MEC4881447.1 DUF6152 family protein [Scytonema sp. PMC 1070.18]